MPVVHLYDPPERFVAGTVGEPGHRTFFLQARSGPRVTSVALEKEQVAALAERVDAMLDEVLRNAPSGIPVPAVAPVELEDKEPLEQPIDEEFRVGTITLSWDGTTELVVLELFSLDDDPAEEAGDGDPGEEGEDDETRADEVLEIRLSAAAARAFAKRAQSVVAAGRPACPFCGNPLDPEGHICPRANGFRRLAQ